MKQNEKEFIALSFAHNLMMLQDGKSMNDAIASNSQLLCYVYNRCRQIFGLDNGADMAESWKKAKKRLFDDYALTIANLNLEE